MDLICNLYDRLDAVLLSRLPLNTRHRSGRAASFSGRSGDSANGRPKGIDEPSSDDESQMLLDTYDKEAQLLTSKAAKRARKDADKAQQRASRKQKRRVIHGTYARE